VRIVDDPLSQIKSSPQPKGTLMHSRQEKQDLSPEIDKYRTEQMNNLIESSKAEEFFSHNLKALESQFDKIRLSENATGEVLELYQHFIKRFQDKDKILSRYKSLLSGMSDREISTLGSISQKPEIQQFNSIEPYRPIPDPSPFRATLVDEYCKKLDSKKHVAHMIHSTFTTIARIFNKPEMGEPKFLESLGAIDVSKKAILWRLRSFTDEQAETVIALKSLPASVKEEKIRQRVLEELMSDEEAQSASPESSPIGK